MTWAKVLPWILLVALGVIFYFWIKSHTPSAGTGDNSKDSIINDQKNKISSLQKSEADFATENRDLLDSIAKLHGAKPGAVKEIVIQKITVHDTIKGKDIIKIIQDSNGLKTASQFFTNPYYNIQATLDFRNYDSSFVTLISYDTLTLVWKAVKTGSIFNRKNFLQLDIHNANPHAQTTGLHGYKQAVPKTPAFGLGIFLGYGFAFKNQNLAPTPLIGAGISWTPIKF